MPERYAVQHFRNLRWGTQEQCTVIGRHRAKTERSAADPPRKTDLPFTGPVTRMQRPAPLTQPCQRRSFLPARSAASPCRGSDRPTVSSATGFPLSAGACTSVLRTKCRGISCATYRTWHRKCPACGRPPARTSPVRPA